TVVAGSRSLIRPERGFWESGRNAFGAGDNSSRPFIGRIDGHTFRIRRDIRYRNSFLPLVWGRVTPLPRGSRVKVTMFMHPLVFLFMAFWLSFVGYVAIHAFTNRHASGPVLFPVGMFAFGLVLC